MIRQADPSEIFTLAATFRWESVGFRASIWLIFRIVQRKPLNRETDKREIRLIGTHFWDKFISNNRIYIG